MLGLPSLEITVFNLLLVFNIHLTPYIDSIRGFLLPLLMEQDLSKPFVKAYREGDYVVLETNLPNDTIGDLAFEYDFDGSERKKWEEYIKDLEAKGIRGQLLHKKINWFYDKRFDKPEDFKEYPLTSYKFEILNLTTDE